MRFLQLLVILLLGFAGGWLLRDRLPEPANEPADSVPARTRSPDAATTSDPQSLVEAGQYRQVVETLDGELSQLIALAESVRPDQGLVLLRTANEVRGETFGVTMAMVSLQVARENYQAAVDLLLRAAVLVNNEAEDMRFQSKLDSVIEAYARALVAAEDFDSLDNLYQTITLALPEQAEYYLKLGRLRVRMGDFERALVPLAHIENDRQWGERARDLMAQAEASEVRGESGQQELNLRREGNQFVVEIMIDHNRRAHLLIDTGAAMTIIEAGLLGQMGYSLQDQPQEYFATANGVVEAPVVSIGHLGLGDSGIREVPVGALPLALPDGIDGLLGMNVLRHYEFRIDQTRDRLYLGAGHR